MKFRKFFVTATTVFALTLASQAQAYEDMELERPSGEAMTFDLLIVRPLSLAGAIVGTGIYIVSLPIGFINWNIGDPARRLVIEPLKYTFTRELGDLH